MRPTTVFLAGGVLAVLFGLSFLLVPAMVLPLYGITPDAATVIMSRFFGVALLHLGVLLWLAREARGAAERAMVLAGVVGSAAGVTVALMGVMSGVVNQLGWSTVLIYALLLAGYAACLRRPVPA
jgi:hypothetical protein